MMPRQRWQPPGTAARTHNHSVFSSCVCRCHAYPQPAGLCCSPHTMASAMHRRPRRPRPALRPEAPIPVHAHDPDGSGGTGPYRVSHRRRKPRQQFWIPLSTRPPVLRVGLDAALRCRLPPLGHGRRSPPACQCSELRHVVASHSSALGSRRGCHAQHTRHSPLPTAQVPAVANYRSLGLDRIHPMCSHATLYRLVDDHRRAGKRSYEGFKDSSVA